MDISLKFGQSHQMVSVNEKDLIAVLAPNTMAYGITEEEAVRDALAHPIGTKPLHEIVHPGEKVVIVSSDITRPMPTATVMPFLLEELYAAGIGAQDITLVFALGSHRPHTKEERRFLAGEQAWNEISCVDTNADDCVLLGYTKRGTPVKVDRTVARADKRICLGNIEYHYFAGYSGGAKAIMPGCSTPDAIQNNHRLMTQQGAYVGNLNGNPVRSDIEEAASLCGVDFILNVVLDEHKKIVKAVAGDVTAAHREGCLFLDMLYKKELHELADIVIVSQGGAPKDLNLYQTQKALDNAKYAVKEGGVIILVGSCKEGMGSKVFEEWMMTAPSPESMIKRIEKQFQLGGHKAAAIAMVLRKAEIYLISEMKPELVEKIFLKPFPDVESAYKRAKEIKGENAKVIIMPYGGSTLPFLKN